MSTQSLVTAVVVAALLAATVPLARRAAVRTADPRLFWLVMVSAGLRFICTGLQEFVNKHAYNGIADFNGYTTRGLVLAHAWRSGHFILGSQGLSGDGAVTTATAAVFTVIGNDQVGAFVVFSWVALLGLLAFQRAFVVAVPDGDRFRYALLLLLFPSLLFWSSAIGKEALMTAALGLAALGSAKILTGQGGGAALVVGLGLGALIRPHEAFLLFISLFVAFALRRSGDGASGRTARKIALMVPLVLVGLVLLQLTSSFLHLHSLSFSSIAAELDKAHRHNSKVGTGFGSSNYAYSANPLRYPQDAYYVLFDPLPFQSHSVTQLIASFENVAVIVALLVSWRRIIGTGRRMTREPYVALCTIYSLGFLYIFASLGNLGLIDRERTLLFPFMLVLLALPAASPMVHRTGSSMRQPAHRSGRSRTRTTPYSPSHSTR